MNSIATLMSDVEEKRRQREKERATSTRIARDLLRRIESARFAEERAG